MKRQDILEIIVSNPRAIFLNANAVANKYSEYPRQYQIIGMAEDKSYVRVQAVAVVIEDYLRNEEGGYLRDESNRVIEDNRPLEERTSIKRATTVQSMPTRLVLKSDLTEESILSNYLAKEQTRKAEQAEHEAKRARIDSDIAELAPMLVTFGLLENAEDINGRWGRVSLTLEGEQIARLTSVLKSALVEAGV